MKILYPPSDIFPYGHNSLEVLGTDRLEILATQLATELKIMEDKRGVKNLLFEVNESSDRLLTDYLYLTSTFQSHNHTPASEWFLDNFHIIEDQLRSIKRDLPKNFYDELPKISEGDFKGYPRVYALAYTYVSKTDSHLELESMKRFMQAFQKKTPLTIGELWAIAITFRIALIQKISPLVKRIIFARQRRDEADLLAETIMDLANKQDTALESLTKHLGENISQEQMCCTPFLVQLIQRLREQDPLIAKAYDWIEQRLQDNGKTTHDIVQFEHLHQATAQVTIGNIISSMRLLSNIDWHIFFEEISLIDQVLGQDPSGDYKLMDRMTQDSYRKVIERLSKHSGISEIEVGEKAVQFAKSQKSAEGENLRRMHVGHFLLDEGVFELERSLGYESPLKEKIIRFVDEDPSYIYFGCLTLLMIFFTSFILKVFSVPHHHLIYILGLIILISIPVSDLSINLLNYCITLLRNPKRLPKMETSKGIRKQDTTMVVVPCLLSSRSTIQELAQNLEVQYLANKDRYIYFAILGDLTDADTETTAEDQDLLNLGYQLIEELNSRYKEQSNPKFYLFHRARLYNPNEKKWICWERKRGKILEFNRFIRGDLSTTFLSPLKENDFLKDIKYIITLDADTQLPLQNARRLIGTISHPLNLPVYDASQNRIVAGYGIIQPRISISIVSAAKTRFSRIFSGNTGIDPYTTAVSDVYQDLFNEGSFTGKGLYVVDTFEKVIGPRVPENTVLSHDLLEGSYARVGLTSDIELIDDYPTHFEIYLKRLHRWTRGDWQIALWILPFVPNAEKKWVRNNLPFVARWKICDNLRRSLLTPVILLWLILSWTFLDGNPLHWTMAITLMMSFSVYAPSLTELFRRSECSLKEHFKTRLSEIQKRIEQIVFMVIFMPAIAIDQLDAIGRAIYRMLISREHLLEWVTFSQIQNQTKATSNLSLKSFLTTGPIFSGCLFITLLFIKPESLLIATPFLLLWSMAPWISNFTKKRVPSKIKNLDQDEIGQYRRYARLTWHFFEQFSGAQNNWLAPDNFQEDPKPVIATRTSPTNIGLHFLSILSAYDLGHIGFRQMVELIEKTMGSLLKLEKMHGHFYNWYDTLSLSPLHPRYISSVDSGNLAGHLIVLKEACLKLIQGPYLNPHAIQGYLDTLNILIQKTHTHQKMVYNHEKDSFNQLIKLLSDAKVKGEKFDWNNKLNLFLEIEELTHILIEDKDSEVVAWMNSLKKQIHAFKQDEELGHHDLTLKLTQIAQDCEEIYLSMDFKFLFDEDRKIFSIGHNVTDGRRDDSYYDLLASESRLASFFAIAKGDVPDEHWFRLGRQLTSVSGSRALISWSATMFEYLMPLLVMRRYDETLLDMTYDTVVLRQMEYGKQRQIPWGISEAGYNARDVNFNYQYGPFGIPGLGLKRGLRDELVISPYSTMLAAMVFPKESLDNLVHLEKMDVLGRYGFYESIDYTMQRIPKNKKSVVLKSFMAHHQGMSLISINNLINKSVMQRRFHSDARVKAVELLLQERIPAAAQIASPRAEETHIESFARFNEEARTRIYNDPGLSTPRTQILSNGNYSVMISSAGSGYSKCEDSMLTRWREDPTLDNWGQYIYIQNISNRKTWSVGLHPTLVRAHNYESHFSEDKIELLREDHGVSTHTEIIVSCEDNVEMRRVSLTNNTKITLELEITSFMEMAIAKIEDDTAHPAFNKLFIQTEFQPQFHALLANRRKRSSIEREIWGLHLMTIEGEAVGPVQYETDRCRFIGRGRTVWRPIVMSNEIELSNTTGPVLDPIFSLRQRIKIKPRETARVTYSTGVAYSKSEALRLCEKYHDPHIFLRQVNLGWVKAHVALRHLNITIEKAHLYQRLGGRMLYLASYLRAQSDILLENKKNQSALWAYGISGDQPILLSGIQEEKDIEMIKELLKAHEYLRLKGLKIDLVILNERSTSYLQHLQDELMRQILISGLHSLLDKPGGIFIRRADLIPAQDLILLKSIARVCLFANKGTLLEQLRRRPYEMELPPSFIPTARKKDFPRMSLETPQLEFFNGFGGFTPDGREYVIYLKDYKWTPAPWINVIANKNDFGCLVSESGLGQTWSVNSRENRLSPWSNDPVSDSPSEVIYIRDEESGAIWTPTPLPIRGPEATLISHGQGHTEFVHNSHGLNQRLKIFVALNDSVKILSLKIKNPLTQTRKLSVTGYIDWVLGFSKPRCAQTVVTNWDDKTRALLATNTYNNEFSERVAFISTNLQKQTFTGDRKEFLGRNGSMEQPAALLRKNLSGKVGAGLDPCGAIQSIIELSPGEEKEVIILIGQSENESQAKEMITFYQNLENVHKAFLEVCEYWDQTLGVIQIKTPDLAMNLLANRWLLYQTLSCRMWARSAFYQSGGAFGFRDQLQDSMALIYSHPETTRSHILLAASRQFPEGDVQHWWHPPTGRGVRTRFSDDLLWLPFVVNFYIKITGDESILDEVIGFIQTPELELGHDETYTLPILSQETGTLYDHCSRAIDRSLKVGSHGLPLMGSGDWNDGMNRVGNLGKGESVWLAWFMMKILKDYATLCEKKNDPKRAQKYLTHLTSLKEAVDSNAWDGEWYLRAYFDNGQTLGSRLNDECKIDSIAQSWSVLSEQGSLERSKKALGSVYQHLVNPNDKLIKLFTPAFDQTSDDPGYIKGYLPGVRENGGQYTHAAIWAMMAFTALKDAETSYELFSMINPINRTRTMTASQKYKVEPYVITADIYGVSPHVGRGGWSWYTGSASWMYRGIIESILGFELYGEKLIMRPCIPRDWAGFEIIYQRGKSRYEIKIINNQEEDRIELDGDVLTSREVSIIDDGSSHVLIVYLKLN